MVAFKDGFFLPVAVVLTAAFGVGVVTGRASVPSPRDDTVPAIRGMNESLDRVNERLTQMSAERCMNVTTSTLQVSVYDAPNLGVKKVSK